jgi:hypothetical protein
MKVYDQSSKLYRKLIEEQSPILKHRFEELIEDQGFIPVKYRNDEVKVYNTSLFMMFLKKSWNVYLKTFVLGYKEGRQYISEVYPDPAVTINDIYYNYFCAPHSGSFIYLIGWQEIKRYHPLKLTHKCSQEYGYYSGIVSMIEELKKRYPITFQNFDKHNVPEVTEKIQLLTIPTKATPEEILSFWLKLEGNDEKGKPYWNRQEIEHFVNQNFEGFPGVNERKEFNPNMNKSELYQVTYTFFYRYGLYESKKLYEDLLLRNFIQIKGTKYVYKLLRNHNLKHLNNLLK